MYRGQTIRAVANEQIFEKMPAIAQAAVASVPQAIIELLPLKKDGKFYFKTTKINAITHGSEDNLKQDQIVGSEIWKMLDKCQHFQLSIENELGVIFPLAWEMGAMCRRKGLDDNKAYDVTLALSEALANALEHGNLEISSRLKANVLEDASVDWFQFVNGLSNEPRFRLRRISIAMLSTATGFTWTITDDGCGFEHETVLKKISQVSTGNSYRGLSIINSITDELTFRGKGNCVSITKNF